MKKGIWYATVAHVFGTICAVALGWFLPTWFHIFEPVEPAQYTFATAIACWGCWKLFEIVTGQDAMANKTAEYFANKKKKHDDIL